MNFTLIFKKGKSTQQRQAVGAHEVSIIKRSMKEEGWTFADIMVTR